MLGVLTGALGRISGVLLLDLDLGCDDDGVPIDGSMLVGPLRLAGWQVIIMTGSQDQPHIAAAVAAGAVGVVPKSGSLSELAQAAVDVLRGRELMSADERRHWEQLHRQASSARTRREELLGRLTSRETQVLSLLAQGFRVAGVARQLGVAVGTVRTQVKSIRQKLEVNSQIEALAIYRGDARPGQPAG